MTIGQINSILTRILLLIVGAPLAWSSMDIGRVLYDAAMSAWENPDHHNGWPIFFSCELCAALLVIGIVILSRLMSRIKKGQRCDVGTTLEAIGNALCFLFPFGVFIASFEGSSKAWVHSLDFMIFLGAAPVVFVVKDVFLDVFSPEDSRETTSRRT